MRDSFPFKGQSTKYGGNGGGTIDDDNGNFAFMEGYACSGGGNVINAKAYFLKYDCS